MSQTSTVNPVPIQNGNSEVGDDGLRVVETHDKGHCFRVIEPDGRVSVTIWAGSSPTKPTASGKFHVRHTGYGQEIIDPEGVVYANTTDPEKAKHICNLLIVWERLKAKQTGSGSSPGDPQKQN